MISNKKYQNVKKAMDLRNKKYPICATLTMNNDLGRLAVKHTDD